MSDAARRPPAGLDTSVPNVARMNDYFLGGKDNFAADRAAAEEVLAIAPEIRTMAKESQAFVGRAVRHLVERGITQFVSIGSGLPTQRNVHQVAQSLDPAARVLYVADDPVVLSHAMALLATDPRTSVVRGDLLHPDELLADHELRRLIDLERPVALLIPSALQFIPGEDGPFKSVALLRDAVAVGSHLVIAHAVFDTRPEAAGPLVDIYRRVLGRSEDASRTRKQVLRFFDGMELIDPGLVYIRQWRPDNPLAAQRPEKVWTVAGVARKTG
ncbi:MULTISPECIES: SAM-dependent methyltransferase [Streptosporangium]|uniref:O-methyltransferase involved in polyketide biosynthesis n=1 Tax=Streptosporangium brasiliense TaxID=47480 RepID=A0ABT9RG72_9ACTN|nr:SAM-dependent methyltransferase [Streptosporangium brasiliense]MDP9867724.1 O-methyltransferase involved in polyketide biosynthesis [Streptosporangium brasiliense]